MSALVKVSLRNGAIAGMLGAVLVIGLYYFGRHPFLIPVFFDFRIILFGVFIYFSLTELRDYYQQGILYLWQGLIGSFIFIATFALFSSAGLWFFAQAVPEFVSSYIDLSMLQLRSLPADTIEKIGKDIYQRNLELLPTTNGFDLALLYFWQSFMIGLFISIILSVILRRQPKT